MTSAGASPGSIARAICHRDRPSRGAVSRAESRRRRGAVTSHAQAMPISPHSAPIRKPAGKRIAPPSDETMVMSGLPSALFTGAKRICTVMKISRSEEHTSELQSLMRISYAVFCLKKKKNKQQSQSVQHTYTDIQHSITTHHTPHHPYPHNTN